MQETSGTDAVVSRGPKARRSSSRPVPPGDASAPAHAEGNAPSGHASTLQPSAPTGQSAAAIAPSIEALLLSIDKPLTPYRIAQALGLITEDDDRHGSHPLLAPACAGNPGSPPRGKTTKRSAPGTPSPLTLVAEAITLLNTQYHQTSRAFRVEEVAGGYRVMTLPQFSQVLEAYHGRRERASLSRAAVETLAIIAYKQPITRASLESIRGVACGEILRSLMERRLVTITGRAEELGRPMLYGTSRQFLEVFGLSSIKDLPSVEEFKKRTGGGEDD